MNPDKLRINPKAVEFVKHFFDAKVTEGTGELVIAIVALGIAIVIARFLYRRKIFLRL